MTLHIVKINGETWYHGPNAENALDHVMTAIRSGEVSIEHTKQPWPKMLGRIQVQCCAGVDFHASDCPVLRP